MKELDSILCAVAYENPHTAIRNVEDKLCLTVGQHSAWLEAHLAIRATTYRMVTNDSHTSEWTDMFTVRELLDMWAENRKDCTHEG